MPEAKVEYAKHAASACRKSAVAMLLDTQVVQDNIMDHLLLKFRRYTAHLNLTLEQEADLLLLAGSIGGEMAGVYADDAGYSVDALAFVPGYIAATGARLGQTLGLE